jgi:hypothetical protein
MHWGLLSIILLFGVQSACKYTETIKTFSLRWIIFSFIGVGNCDDFCGRIIYRMSAHFFPHRFIDRILLRKFNTECTISDCSSFHPLFLSLPFYFRAYIWLYLYVYGGRIIYYVKIFILTLCLLPPPLRSIILQNIFLLQMILSHLLLEKITSPHHITVH